MLVFKAKGHTNQKIPKQLAYLVNLHTWPHKYLCQMFVCIRWKGHTMKGLALANLSPEKNEQ